MTTDHATCLPRRHAVNQLVADPLVNPLAVVMDHELVDRVSEVALPQRDHAMQTLFDRTHESPRARMAVGCPVRRLDDADTDLLECQLASRYWRLFRHRGHKKAVFAVAHALLVTAYHLLARGTTYQELGANYYDQRDSERITRQAVRALERQGYRVTLKHAA